MTPRFLNSMTSQGYGALWNKYRPAILQMMVAAMESHQSYQLFKHEFSTLNSKEKGYTFTLEAHKGKAVNDIRKSNVAKDLLSMLTSSPKAMELLDSAAYTFSLDKHYVLHIIRQDTEAVEETTEETSAE